MSGGSELQLRDWAASVLIANHMQENTKINPDRADDINEMLKGRWDTLKAEAGVTIKAITTVMERIENKVLRKEGTDSSNPERGRVLTKKASQLFSKLAKKCQTQSCFGGITPVSIEAYAHLQQKWEEEALLVLWREVHLQLGASAPELSTKEIRAWFADSANAPQLMGITKLHLSHHQIKVIPPEIGLCTQLQELYLNGNRITSIPVEIGCCTQLQKLDIRYNQITSIPSAIGSCTQLQVLNLNGNKITSISPKIGSCTLLSQLDLRNNKITSIPAEIGHCTQLQELNLTGNQISLIPSTIGFCTQLLRLCLGGNQITSIPSEIRSCAQLQTLHLGANRVTSFPVEIFPCAQLQKLYLNNNQIGSIPPEIGSCAQLRGLYLSYNQIPSIPDEIYEFCRQLPRFSLDNNPIPNDFKYYLID
jgi:Leucine-rich repeat (LRR) protein